jgi:hypothetical protein
MRRAIEPYIGTQNLKLTLDISFDAATTVTVVSRRTNNQGKVLLCCGSNVAVCSQ